MIDDISSLIIDYSSLKVFRLKKSVNPELTPLLFELYNVEVSFYPIRYS